MEALTITIEPPITEYCKKCDYEASRSFGGYLYTCPQCGENGIGHGARPLEKQSLRVTKYQGSFNLIDPSEKQWQYVFTNTPSGKRYSFVVDDELELDNPIDLAIELKEIIDMYFYNSSKEVIAELVEAIDTDEYREDQDILRISERRTKLERDLYELNYTTTHYG